MVIQNLELGSKVLCGLCENSGYFMYFIAADSASCSPNYKQSLFSLSVERNARDTQMTTRVTEGGRGSTFARACAPLAIYVYRSRLWAPDV